MEKFFMNFVMSVLVLFIFMLINLVWPVITVRQWAMNDLISLQITYSLGGFILFGIHTMFAGESTEEIDYEVDSKTLFWFSVAGEIFLCRYLSLSLGQQFLSFIVINLLLTGSYIFVNHFSFYDEQHKKIIS